MDLLSNAQRAEIRAALRDATDTFHKTPITYYRTTSSLDRWQEDRDDSLEPYAVTLMCMIEYRKDTTAWALATSSEGLLDRAEVMVSFNMDYLNEVGFADGAVATFDEGDEFVANGQRYKVLLVTYDGPLENKNVLAVIYAETRL